MSRLRDQLPTLTKFHLLVVALFHIVDFSMLFLVFQMVLDNDELNMEVAITGCLRHSDFVDKELHWNYIQHIRLYSKLLEIIVLHELVHDLILHEFACLIHKQ